MGINVELLRQEPSARPLTKGKCQERPLFTVLDQVIDWDEILPRMLDRVHDSGRTPTIDRIEPHGDVIFDEAQVRSLLVELPQLARVSRGESEQQIMRELQRLGMACLATPVLQLRFVGD
ncbi:hypothetical protein HD597_000741 [Nonomuraea thailandensis]|uniref:Uncharacterized protein n=1 Tax=Nonomuraea thailandensis TaxID=1188745 RepID=A0A9X2G7K1_9ACTN|nr:hypothetical protein [Nonomuraea thailandensis]MCP2353721.1 hypothetical protein [Nonomuraea thailandensis]